jgi:hypothetical protein
LLFSDYFDLLISKIILKKQKKKLINIFLNKKYIFFKKYYYIFKYAVEHAAHNLNGIFGA